MFSSGKAWTDEFTGAWCTTSVKSAPPAVGQPGSVLDISCVCRAVRALRCVAVRLPAPLCRSSLTIPYSGSTTHGRGPADEAHTATARRAARSGSCCRGLLESAAATCWQRRNEAVCQLDHRLMMSRYPSRGPLGEEDQRADVPILPKRGPLPAGASPLDVGPGARQYRSGPHRPGLTMDICQSCSRFGEQQAAWCPMDRTDTREVHVRDDPSHCQLRHYRLPR